MQKRETKKSYRAKNGAFSRQYKNNKSIGSDKIENILKRYHRPKDILLKNVTAMAIVKASIRFNTMY